MFRTEIAITPAAKKMTLAHQYITLGSCFAAMMGTKLAMNKFNVVQNPLGIVYNPFSLHSSMNLALDASPPDMQRVTNLHGQFVHHDFHSQLHSPTIETLEETLRVHLATLRKGLREADWLIITYGTAIYHALNNRPVANCHKQPASMFQRKTGTLEEMETVAEHSIQNLLSLNPALKIILTVSPVRHVKETLPKNSFSKSLLRALCENLSENHPRIDYFPSFEIMMDDLRDYRFYTPDLIHPNEVAEDYIWSKFNECYFDTSTQTILKEWKLVQRNLQHRPFHAGSADHRKFLTATLHRLEALSVKINVDGEIKAVKNLLAHA